MDRMDRIIIRDLAARGKIGISEKERQAPQDILINVVMYTDIVKASYSDSIEDCVDYSTMTKSILNLVENNTRKTMEALTSDIADLCLKHQLVKKVVVRAEKTSAVRFVKAAGVEIERQKDPVS